MTWQDKCFALWGDTWKAQLSKMAGLNPRTVRRWATGEIAIRQIHLDKINATYDIWREDNLDLAYRNEEIARAFSLNKKHPIYILLRERELKDIGDMTCLLNSLNTPIEYKHLKDKMIAILNEMRKDLIR